MTEDNLNSQDTNSISNSFILNDIKTLTDDMLIENNMIIQNDKPTFHRPGITSCIDFIVSYCPSKISHITT